MISTRRTGRRYAPSGKKPEWGRPGDLSLSELLYVLWSRKRLVLGVMAVLVLCGGFFGFLRDRSYTAEATISVSPTERGLNQDEKEAFLERVAGVVASDDDLLRSVSREIGWRGDLPGLRERLRADYFVQDNGDSGMTIRFTGRDRDQSAAAANAYAGAFVRRVGELSEQRIAGASLDASARVETRAKASEASATSGGLALYLVVALGAGVLLGGAAALLLEGRAKSWRGARDAEMTLHAPVIGLIPDHDALVSQGEGE